VASLSMAVSVWFIRSFDDWEEDPLL
jgi:hypothetical protein